MAKVISYDWAGGEIIEEIADEIVELRIAFDDMWNAFKECLLLIQKDKEIFDKTNKGVTGSFNNVLTFGQVQTQTITLDEEQAEENITQATPLVCRPIKFGDSYYRLGTTYGEIHFYDENGRAVHHPYSMDEEDEIKNILKEKINNTSDIVDFNCLLLEIQTILPQYIVDKAAKYTRKSV